VGQDEVTRTVSVPLHFYLAIIVCLTTSRIEQIYHWVSGFPALCEATVIVSSVV
jgi:hypothetical protein